MIWAAWAALALISATVSVIAHLRRVAALDALEAPRPRDCLQWLAIDLLMAPFGVPLINWVVEPTYRGDVVAIRDNLLAEHRSDIAVLEAQAFAPYDEPDSDPFQHLREGQALERSIRRQQYIEVR